MILQTRWGREGRAWISSTTVFSSGTTRPRCDQVVQLESLDLRVGETGTCDSSGWAIRRSPPSRVAWQTLDTNWAAAQSESRTVREPELHLLPPFEARRMQRGPGSWRQSGTNQLRIHIIGPRSRDGECAAATQIISPGPDRFRVRLLRELPERGMGGP